MKEGAIRRDTGNAEELAGRALLFFAGDAERLGSFLAASGLDPRRIREVAGETGFLVGVLDYILADEPLLLAFAMEEGIRAEHVMQARLALAGPVTE
ncbi:DUF3572 domain-containing protein [Terrihabitans sp. B22-R8]|uniref:DUF3572 domain-containing protein n=1 Tax=Terrihabitans sp. B22-R8 TaxID=3425128 RepID=UPI00403C9EA1